MINYFCKIGLAFFLLKGSNILFSQQRLLFYATLNNENKTCSDYNHFKESYNGCIELKIDTVDKNRDLFWSKKKKAFVFFDNKDNAFVLGKNQLFSMKKANYLQNCKINHIIIQVILRGVSEPFMSVNTQCLTKEQLTYIRNIEKEVNELNRSARIYIIIRVEDEFGYSFELNTIIFDIHPDNK